MKFFSKKTFFIFPFLTSIYLQAQEKPNLVFIMADQWRGDALGCLGKEPVKTPCLDQLAREGVNFTNAVSSYPVSSPARGMLMTGMYPHKNKVTGNCNSANAPYGVELPQDARCWSDILKANGYQTGYIGKWHLDAPHEPYIDTYNNHGAVAWNEWCPKERRHGFDYWTAYGTYDYHLKPMYWDTDAPRDSFYYVNQWGPEYEADKAIEYLNGHIDKTQPFALVVSMNPPHTGYELVPDRYKEMYKNLNVEALCANRPDIPAKGTEMGDYFRNNIRNYYACMTGVDENIGRIINELKRLGLFKNTIVVFTSDHGICMGAHEQAGKDIFMRNPCEFQSLSHGRKNKAENRPNNHDSFCRLVSDPAFHHGLSATNTGRSTNIRPCFRSPLRKRKQPHCPTLLLHTVIQSGNRLPGITHRYTYVYYPCNRW